MIHQLTASALEEIWRRVLDARARRRWEKAPFVDAWFREYPNGFMAEVEIVKEVDTTDQTIRLFKASVFRHLHRVKEETFDDSGEACRWCDESVDAAIREIGP